MAAFLKPDNLNIVWASGGDRLYPGDTKYQSGWGVEIPPRQYFNEIDYKQDQMLAHLNQRGIAEWDSTTEYQAGKSYVQDNTGTIFRCTTTNTGINPVGDTTNSWTRAFAAAGELPLLETNFIQYSNGLVDQWASASAVVASPVGSKTNIVVTLPKRLSSVVNIQVTQDHNSPTANEEGAEMSYSVTSITLGELTTTVNVRFNRVVGSNSGGNESVSVGVRVLGYV